MSGYDSGFGSMNIFNPTSSASDEDESTRGTSILDESTRGTSTEEPACIPSWSSSDALRGIRRHIHRCSTELLSAFNEEDATGSTTSQDEMPSGVATHTGVIIGLCVAGLVLGGFLLAKYVQRRNQRKDSLLEGQN